MKVYSVGEVAEQLNIKTPTLRKYCIMLEEEGMNFERNSRNQRYFKDSDIMTLRAIIRARDNGTTLKEAVRGVVHQTKDITATNDTNNAEAHNSSDIEELKELIHKQNELIGELFTRLDQQQEYINEVLQDHKKLIEETQETKQQIAATEEEEKGFFARLFGK